MLLFIIGYCYWIGTDSHIIEGQQTHHPLQRTDPIQDQS